MTKDIITSVIILLLLIAFALWSIAHNIKESIVDVTFAIEKMSAEIRRVRESIEGLREETAKLRICANWDTSWKPSTDRKCFYCPVVDYFVDGDFWCKNGERKVKNDGQTDFAASCD